MTQVRKHTRQLTSGVTVTVRRHERRGGSPAAMPKRRHGKPGGASQGVFARAFASWRNRRRDPGEDWWADEDPVVGTGRGKSQVMADAGRKAEADGADADVWVADLKADHEADVGAETERIKTQMRDWRSRPEPEPSPGEPMSPELAKLLGTDTPEGRDRYDRLRAYREAGYDGPLDRENRIPDPDDPATEPGLSMLADMAVRRRGK